MCVRRKENEGPDSVCCTRIISPSVCIILEHPCSTTNSRWESKLSSGMTSSGESWFYLGGIGPTILLTIYSWLQIRGLGVPPPKVEVSVCRKIKWLYSKHMTTRKYTIACIAIPLCSSWRPFTSACCCIHECNKYQWHNSSCEYAVPQYYISNSWRERELEFWFFCCSEVQTLSSYTR